MATFTYEARDLSGRTVSGTIEAEAPQAAARSLQEQGLFATRIDRATAPAVAAASAPLTSVAPEVDSPAATTPGAGSPLGVIGGGVNGGGAAAMSSGVSTVPLSPVGQAMPLSESETLLPTSSLGQSTPLTALGNPAQTTTGYPYPAADPGPTAFEPDEDYAQIRLIPWAFGVKYQDLAVFYRELATLQNAGISMVQALHLLAEQARSGRLRTVLAEAATAVSNGHTLSSVMRNHRTIFTRIHVEMIRAGEISGGIDQMCLRLAEYLEREIELKRKMARETLYPKIVLVCAYLVVLLLCGLLGGPHLAGIVFGIGIALLFVWLFLIWLGAYLYQYPGVAQFWDRFKLIIPPWWGGVRRRYATSRFCRALATLYGGGVILSRAVTISARACGNHAIGEMLLSQAAALSSGMDLSTVLTASGALSGLAVKMARTGQETGSLDTMMYKVADYLESEADMKAHQYAVAQGVAISLIAGMVVLAVAIVFFTGYFNMVFKAGDAAG